MAVVVAVVDQERSHASGRTEATEKTAGVGVAGEVALAALPG